MKNFFKSVTKNISKWKTFSKVQQKIFENRKLFQKFSKIYFKVEKFLEVQRKLFKSRKLFLKLWKTISKVLRKLCEKRVEKYFFETCVTKYLQKV